VLPLPSKTVVGKPLGFAENVLYKSAYKTPDGALIINPPEFIRLVKAHRS
jgi:hypothetical protein